MRLISGKQSSMPVAVSLLKTSQKAAAEAELESAFTNFENQFANAAGAGKVKK